MIPEFLTIADISGHLRVKDFSCRELVTAHLERIKNDRVTNAWLRVSSEALTAADQVDQQIARGDERPSLSGIPIAIKDNILVQGEIATAASKILEHYRAVYTATAVEKLTAAGAIILGKTNLDEFAMGASTENSAYGPTRNPWNHELVPGGSSGGSAAAVAADQAVAALGSDTGGSIRQPASFCGVVGLKPTYGRVSRYGLIALASSLDQIGPLTRSVADAAAVYQAIAGPDKFDHTTIPGTTPPVAPHLDEGVEGLRIGWPREYFGPGVDQGVIDTITAAAAVYKKLGAEIIEVSIPHVPHALPTYYIIQPAEASSNLARYDGIRYGLSRRDQGGLEDIYRRSRGQGFGAEVKRRIMVGTFVLSSGYADAYYHQANRVRQLLSEEFHQVFDRVDLLLAPTAPTAPFRLDANTQDPLTMYQADLLTVPANMTGLPAISVPAGFIGGAPIGLQLIGSHGDEATIFRAAQAYEQATDWHRQHPPAVA